MSELRACQVLDTEPEPGFDDVVVLASQVAATPIALVSLVDSDRQWFKARVGLEPQQTPRDVAFCAHAILRDEPLIVPDARQDERFQDNPLVTGPPHVISYAGFPLRSGQHRLGTLCVIDHVPRKLKPQQVDVLRRLARQVEAQLELRRSVHELRLAREQLADKCSELEHIVSSLSHDLQEPLRTVDSFIRLFMAEYGARVEGEARQYLEFAADGARRGRSMIDSLLAFWKTRGTTKPGQVDLTELLDEVRLDLGAVVNREQAVIAGEELPNIVGHRPLLRQLLQNLLSNALKFRSAAPPVVRVSCAQEDRRWLLSVSDNGAGIDGDRLERIFDPFYTSDSSGSRGTGMGLAIAKRVVQVHGGDIWVAETGKTGTTFAISLPVVRSSEVAA